MSTNLARLQSNLLSSISSADHTLAKFTEKLGQDPMYAFEWAQGAQEAAAQRHVALAVTAWIERILAKPGYDDDNVFAEICKGITKEALRQAARVHCSTSATSNTVNEYARMHWAKLAEDLSYA